jgi:dCMP deaminase
MLVGITGPPSSGKAAIARWLIETKSFEFIQLLPSAGGHGSVRPKDVEVANEPHGALQSKYAPMVANDIMDFLLTDFRWKLNYVVCPVMHIEDVEIFKKRPWFLLLSVDAPLSVRYWRWVRHPGRDHQASGSSLARFVEMNDAETFCMPMPLEPSAATDEFEQASAARTAASETISSLPYPNTLPLLPHHFSDLSLFNPFAKLSQLHQQLEQLNPPLTSESRLRPPWDDYFMLLADLAAHRSNCMKRRVGCILVVNNRIVSTGYNGTPRGVRNCNEGGCPRCNRGSVRCGVGLDECLCLHAEENALLEAGRERLSVGVVEGNRGAVLYCNTCPCLGCAKKIIQVGVKEVVYRQEYGMDVQTARLLQEARVALKKHKPVVSLHLSSLAVGEVPFSGASSKDFGELYDKVMSGLPNIL